MPQKELIRSDVSELLKKIVKHKRYFHYYINNNHAIVIVCFYSNSNKKLEIIQNFHETDIKFFYRVLRILG